MSRDCFLFQKGGLRMRPPKSPAKCIHHVAIYAPPPDSDAPAAASHAHAAPQHSLGRAQPSPSPAPSLDGPLASTATAETGSRPLPRPPSATATVAHDVAAPATVSGSGRSPRPPAALGVAHGDSALRSPRPPSVLAPRASVADTGLPSDSAAPSPRPASSRAAPFGAPAVAATPTALTPRGGPAAAARLCGILSQSDVIRFIDSKERERQESSRRAGGQGFPLMHKSVKELGLAGFSPAEIPPSPSTTSSENSDLRGKAAAGGARMTLVPGSVTSLEAFRRMCMARDSGVGVLAANGTLKATLSPLDLRHLVPGRFHTLLQPVDEFLQKRPLLQAARADAGEARRFLLLLTDL
jgi:hypothetical protein